MNTPEHYINHLNVWEIKTNYLPIIKIMKKPAIQLLCCVLGSIMLAGCFKLREPEKPNTIGGWTSPTQPSILLDNMRLAVTTLNPVNYERCFVPSGFRFIPDPGTAGVSTGLFDNWWVQEERTYLTNLKESTTVTTANQLSFTEKREVFFTVDSLELSANYNLAIQHEDTTFRHYRYVGSMRLILRRRQNEWQIQSWQDNRLTDSLCWTDLKKHFYAH